MRFKSGIRSRIIVNFGAIMVMTVVILEFMFVVFIRNYYFEGVEQVLKDKASISSDSINRIISSDDISETAKWLFESDALDMDNRFYLQLIDKKDLKVVMDSNGFSDRTEMNYPDVIDAINDKLTVYEGRNEFSGERIMSVSRPLLGKNQVIGILRYTISLEKVYRAVRNYIFGGMLLGFTVILFFMIMAMIVSRSIVNPLFELNAVAKNMALGNFEVKAVKKYDDEIGLLADTINFMSDEIRRTERMKKDFISSISHELRTPLTSIKGWSETLLLEKGSTEEDSMSMGLHIISSEAERLSDMVEELLDFSRLESRKIRINKKLMSPKELLEDVCMQFSPKAVEHSLKMEYQGKDTLIMADINKMRQVFINLISNSIKFTPPGGTIVVRGEGFEDKVVIRVIDTGVGIPKYYLPKVREKFFKGSQSTPGSGLGLSIVEEIVKLHEAQMEIESTIGEGTMVTLTLPAADPPQEQPVFFQ